MSDHVTGTRRTTRQKAGGDPQRGYRGICSCGWEGIFRFVPAQAQDDATAHANVAKLGRNL